ncbi:MAG: ATP-binding cassette domain-containing protein [Phycisphaerae bacterium]|nr:ATP-binding cassette domain-containing protein [Gemmatimonadaceae bacterium]
MSSHNPNGPSPLRRLASLLSPERRDISTILLYGAIVGVLGLAVPLGVQAIIGLVSGGLLLQPVLLLIGFVVIATLGAGLLQVAQLAVVERVQQRIFARISLESAHRVSRANVEALRGMNLPEATNRFFEVITIQKCLAKLLTDGVTALLAILAGLVLLTLYHPYLSAFGLILLAALSIVLWVTGRTGLETSLAESASKYWVAHWLQELARNATAFRQTGTTTLPVGRMDEGVHEYLEQRDAHFRVLARQSTAVIVVKTAITGGLLVIGTSLVVDRSITLGQFVASELVIVALLGGVEKLILSLGTVYDALTAVEKLAVIQELPMSRATEPLLPHSSPELAAADVLAARDVSYRYGAAVEPAISDVSLQLRAGERVGIVSSEGAGASTLLRVIAGMLPSYQGVITVNGISAHDAHTDAFRQRVVLVESQVELIDGTIEDNISMGRDRVTAADVSWACELVMLDEHLHSLPAGLHTAVGGANRLPAFVERKIALARALSGRPALLLFDEFFHHLDPLYKLELLQRLRSLESQLTILAASHDTHFLESCDRVLFLREGHVEYLGAFRDRPHAATNTQFAVLTS